MFFRYVYISFFDLYTWPLGAHVGKGHYFFFRTGGFKIFFFHTSGFFFTMNRITSVFTICWENSHRKKKYDPSDCSHFKNVLIWGSTLCLLCARRKVCQLGLESNDPRWLKVCKCLRACMLIWKCAHALATGVCMFSIDYVRKPFRCDIRLKV